MISNKYILRKKVLEFGGVVLVYVTSSGILKVTPMEAFEFYIWVFEKNRTQPNWSDFKITSKVGNKIWFSAMYSLFGKKFSLEGVGVLSPERFIEFRIEKIGWNILKANPAIVRYALQENRGTTLVTKTWHFMFEAKLKRAYEWAVAFQIKRHLRSSFRADQLNLKAWLAKNVSEETKGYVINR
ncbi:hypothetical protein B9Q11_00330 [Candidatus Marsarchaeota G2 archaeon ECH_B_SAG-F08]|jgi:hypothetical protein|nr:MAG: hypothetical protein B9Q11_00330 [Candidatus Marsarchaeota G2 archaeon ECH_B_SAG-F08]